MALGWFSPFISDSRFTIVFGTAADGSSQLNPPFGEAPYLAVLSHAP